MIDSHIHLFKNGFEGGKARDEELRIYEKLRARHGIEAALVVGYEGESWSQENNRYLRLNRRPWMQVLSYLDVSGSSEPTAVGSEDAGIAIYPPPGLAAVEVMRVLEPHLDEIDARRLIVSINARPSSVDVVTEVAGSCPRATVLWSHLGLPVGSEFEAFGAVLAAAAVPNILLKLSGLYALGPRGSRHPHEDLRSVLISTQSVFGPDRLVWGSDFAPSQAHLDFEQTLRIRHLLDVSDAQWSRIVGGTLRSILDRAGHSLSPTPGGTA